MDERQLLLSEAEDASNTTLTVRVWEESKKIWRIALPAMLARVTSYGMFVVAQSYIGHISELDLAAYALVQIISVRFIFGILLGMSSATETLCGQAFGAKQYHMMGIYLQRSWVINLVTATVLIPVLIFATPIFKLLGEEEDIAIATETISLWFIPVIYCSVFNLTIQMFLQTQLKNSIVGWLSALSFLVSLLLSWLFVSVLDLGISGAMGSMIISVFVILAGEFVYICGGWCPDSWKGLSFAAFSDLLPVIKLSISSGVMLCLELWYNAVLVLLAGYMSNAETAISAFSICLNIIAWEFMVFLGFLVAGSVRVSNELGRGDAKAAKFAIKVVMATSLCLGLIFTGLCIAFGDKLAYLFTSEEEVVEAVSNLSLLLGVSVFLNSFQPILSGIAVGAGRQGIVAYVNIGCYYLVGIPVGALLGYVANLEVTGIWIGLIVGVTLQSIVLGYITYKTDWDQQVKLASERLNKWLLKPVEESNENQSQEDIINNGTN